jgi:regulator of sigma E protease
MDHAITTLQVLGAFLLVLGPLIVLHEFGHFIVAKAFGIGVPVFSIGLGPRLFGVKRAKTDYRVSAVPLGGYVRLSGDESDEQRTGAPEEFLSRPKHQRLMVYLAGAALNILLALGLVWAVLMIYGVDEIPRSDAYPVVVGVAAGSPAELSGVKTGDRVLRIGGQDARDESTMMEEVWLRPDSVRELVVERDGRQVHLRLRTGSDPRYRLGDPGWLVLPETHDPPLISQVYDGPARRAGLMPGDLVVGADGRQPITLAELRVLLASSANRELVLRVDRGGQTVEIAVTPELRQGRGVIGVDIGPSNVSHRSFTVLEAAVESLRTNLRLSQTLFLTLGRLVRGDISMRAFSGPLEIAQVSRRAVTGGPESLLGFLAFISLQLGILNLLPIPVLDGGHILILGVEAMLRRDLSERLKERVMQVGLVFLIAFFGVIIYFDAIKTLFSS